MRRRWFKIKEWRTARFAFNEMLWWSLLGKLLVMGNNLRPVKMVLEMTRSRTWTYLG